MKHRIGVPGNRTLAYLSGIVVALLVIATLVGLGPFAGDKTMPITLQFNEANSVYVGDKVTVLDVPIGEVTSINPHRDRVDVKVKVDTDTKLSADVKAVLVAPSLVSIRHIDLTPYRGGPRLQDGATVPVARTASPVEWDQVKDQLARFTAALGPNGANKNGSLSNLLAVSADNLRGRGKDMSETIQSLSKALTTLSAGGDDLFSTVKNLQVFATALDSSQSQIVGFNQRFASVTQALNADKGQLVGALNSVAELFPKLQKFLKDNRKQLVTAVTKLDGPAKYIADNRQNLADILQVAPGTLSNFYNILDPDIPGPTGTFALVNFSNVAEVVCATTFSLGGTPAQCQNLLEPIAKYLNLPAPPAGLIPLLKDGRDNVVPAPPGTTGSGKVAAGGGSSNPTTTQSSGGSLSDLLSGLAGGSR